MLSADDCKMCSYEQSLSGTLLTERMQLVEAHVLYVSGVLAQSIAFSLSGGTHIFNKSGKNLCSRG